ncbi:MAG: hypothetical protein MJ252_29245 [archaeon]|nr:hypothetical protein [archaeon]
MDEKEIDEDAKNAWKNDENFGLILPDTIRVREKQRLAREKKENEDREREERKKKEQEMEMRKKRKKQKELDEKRKADQAKADEQRTKEDARAQIEGRKDNLMELFSTLLRNTSPYELAFPNYKMDGTQEFNLLMTVLEDNSSLLTLSLSRKNLKDEEGIKLAKMLTKNHKLRRLELEGNFLGPDSAREFGKALETNVTLRYLDLENNNLTKKGTNNDGIRDLCNSLIKNKMLISLNLSNNFINGEAGKYLVDLLRSNNILIHLEYFQNKDFEVLPSDKKEDDDSKFKPSGLTIIETEEIKAFLKRNNDAYTKMRTDEWKERKGMTENYEDNVDTKMLLDAKGLEEDARKKERDYIELLYLDNFNQHMKETEDKFNEAVNKYMAETKERLTKKKKKKKKKA